MGELPRVWTGLSELSKVVIAAAFFTSMGATATMLFGSTQQIEPRIATLEDWRHDHTLEYQVTHNQVTALIHKADYLVCIGRQRRTGDTEQDCYEKHLLP